MRSVVTELSSELLPVADRSLFDQRELDLIALLHDSFQSSGFVVGDRLIVAELCCSRTIVARSNNDCLDTLRIESVVNKDSLHVNRVLCDQEVLILGSDDLR